MCKNTSLNFKNHSYFNSVSKANVFSIFLFCSHRSETLKKRGTLPHNMSGFPLVLLGVVHTPVKSNALPSMVFILRKMSALLQVERAGDSVSGLSNLRGSFLCKKRGKYGDYWCEKKKTWAGKTTWKENERPLSLLKFFFLVGIKKLSRPHETSACFCCHTSQRVST